MKSFKRILIIALVAMAAVLPASAQFRFGVKAGVAVNSLKLNKDILDGDNRAGFTGGVMAEFTVPVLGLGMDASVLYASRGAKIEQEVEGTNDVEIVNKTRSYIDIPLNFKWKIGLPVVGKIVSPFITTGPDFSFLCSKKNFQNAISNRKFDVAWNFGVGVQFVNHVQVAASYGLGLTNSVSGSEGLNSTLLKDFKGKNRAWTVTVAYIF
ncbi:MAG: PorT family protein [Muribaculaceae bacterium]|nr:PorT family protein [Muribaculaceae bacterium]MDE5968559.1 PorT family protein [Muribaculaceae bacterium]MDE7392905.1 PorT family protein [Muribaculaceae bacterium]